MTGTMRVALSNTMTVTIPTHLGPDSLMAFTNASDALETSSGISLGGGKAIIFPSFLLFPSSNGLGVFEQTNCALLSGRRQRTTTLTQTVQNPDASSFVFPASAMICFFVLLSVFFHARGTPGPTPLQVWHWFSASDAQPFTSSADRVLDSRKLWRVHCFPVPFFAASCNMLILKHTSRTVMPPHGGPSG